MLGAKLFDICENWSDFLRNPSAYLLSPAGLTFYGGLICATIAIVIYARKHKISLRHLADSVAPALMIAYAIGRIGCQVAGDGDWGIVNTRPNPIGFLPDWMWSFTFPHNVNEAGVPITGVRRQVLQPTATAGLSHGFLRNGDGLYPIRCVVGHAQATEALWCSFRPLPDPQWPGAFPNRKNKGKQ